MLDKSWYLQRKLLTLHIWPVKKLPKKFALSYNSYNNYYILSLSYAVSPIQCSYDIWRIEHK